ncbi:hypothetical protein ACIQUB_04115 [Rhizobium sp. NPDC090275]|uniref:hypothetical protein n=1 Tax=Rhizobium sp. NPDC090275 TaxID=3364498 RepID=UPI0013AF8385
MTVHANNASNGTVMLPVGGSEVSMQVLQDVYAKFTGKKEQISKSISFNHLTSFEDIENLHQKIIQICDQYNVIQRNESIVVYHINNSKDQFSIFDTAYPACSGTYNILR